MSELHTGPIVWIGYSAYPRNYEYNDRVWLWLKGDITSQELERHIRFEVRFCRNYPYIKDKLPQPEVQT